MQRAERQIADLTAGRLGELRGELRPEPVRARAPARAAGPRPRSPRRPAPASRPRRRRRRPPGGRARARRTSRPRWAARQAQARPITPPPTTTTSAVPVVTLLFATDCSLSRRADLASPCAGITRIRFRRSAARRRPLSPIRVGAPVVIQDTPQDGRDETGADRTILRRSRRQRPRRGARPRHRRRGARPRQLQGAVSRRRPRPRRDPRHLRRATRSRRRHGLGARSDPDASGATSPRWRRRSRSRVARAGSTSSRTAAG